jgi:hypothetical protein
VSGIHRYSLFGPEALESVAGRQQSRGWSFQGRKEVKEPPTLGWRPAVQPKSLLSKQASRRLLSNFLFADEVLVGFSLRGREHLNLT